MGCIMARFSFYALSENSVFNISSNLRATIWLCNPRVYLILLEDHSKCLWLRHYIWFDRNNHCLLFIAGISLDHPSCEDEHGFCKFPLIKLPKGNQDNTPHCTLLSVGGLHMIVLIVSLIKQTIPLLWCHCNCSSLRITLFMAEGWSCTCQLKVVFFSFFYWRAVFAARRVGELNFNWWSIIVFCCREIPSA